MGFRSSTAHSFDFKCRDHRITFKCRHSYFTCQSHQVPKHAFSKIRPSCTHVMNFSQTYIYIYCIANYTLNERRFIWISQIFEDMQLISVMPPMKPPLIMTLMESFSAQPSPIQQMSSEMMLWKSLQAKLLHELHKGQPIRPCILAMYTIVGRIKDHALSTSILWLGHHHKDVRHPNRKFCVSCMFAFSYVGVCIDNLENIRQKKQVCIGSAVNIVCVFIMQSSMHVRPSSQQVATSPTPH